MIEFEGSTFEKVTRYYRNKMTEEITSKEFIKASSEYGCNYLVDWEQELEQYGYAGFQIWCEDYDKLFESEKELKLFEASALARKQQQEEEKKQYELNKLILKLTSEPELLDGIKKWLVEN